MSASNPRWRGLDIRRMLQQRRERLEATTSANAGAYPRPFGPVVRRTPGWDALPGDPGVYGTYAGPTGRGDEDLDEYGLPRKRGR